MGGGMQFIASDGSKISLSGMNLKFGGSDTVMSDLVRQRIAEFEQKRYQNKIEFASFVNSKGIQVAENKGGRGSVKSKITDYQKAEAMSHNHPSEQGTLGGTFSDQDMTAFSRFDNLKTMRATAAEGTYSISKGKNFNTQKFENTLIPEIRTQQAAYIKQVRSIGEQYKRGEISYDSYVNQWQKTTNKHLIDSHNYLLKKQGEFGYSYTLERRK